MRIRYFADIRFPLERANGVQTMETCHALARRGHAVDLVVRPDSAVPPRDPFTYYGLPRIAGLTIQLCRVPAAPGSRRVAYLLHALRLSVGARDTDVIFTRDLTLGAALVALPRWLRPPIVYESHGYAPAVSEEMPRLHAGAAALTEAKRSRLEARERRVWEQADGYVTITTGLARDLAERLGPRPDVAVVPDGARLCDIDEVGLRQDPGPDGRVVGYAGHLYPWKGVDVLLQALQHLPGARALVVGGLDGEPDFARVKARAETLAPGRVQCTGQVDPPRVAALLRGTDVLVLPNTPSTISASYTSPLKLFEYMAAGRPIVASDLPSLREVLVHGRNAWLVEPGNPAALAAGLAHVLDDAGLAAHLAGQAREDVRAYTWDARAERLDAVLERAVRRTG